MKQTDLLSLERSVSRTFWVVTALVMLALVSYFLWFFVVHKQPLSDTTSAWGEFGDFVGGLLNPRVAYSAFYWLSRSVLLQKEELLETRQALQESALAQTRQVAVAERAAKIAAFTALLNSAVTEVQSLRAEATAITTQASRHPAGSTRLPNGDWAGIEGVTRHLSSLRGQIEFHTNARIKCENELKVLLAEQARAA